MVRHLPACTCRAHPLPASMLVRDALDAYLAENRFTRSAYDAPRTESSLFGWRFTVPNPPSHRRAIRLHDLLHVATGFGTDHEGEAALSIWQLRSGFAGAGAYAFAISLANVAVGLLASPRRTLVALRTLHGGRSLHDVASAYEGLLDRSVEELRETLGIPATGLAMEPRGLHVHAPPALGR